MTTNDELREHSSVAEQPAGAPAGGPGGSIPPASTRHDSESSYSEFSADAAKPAQTSGQPDGLSKAEQQAARLLGPLRETARENGYALLVHGSLKRDIDLVAVPWAHDAVPQIVLAEAIRLKAAEVNPIGVAFIKPDEDDQFHRDGCPGMKPHGRLCWGFHLGGGPYIDLSVMPPTVPPFQDLHLREPVRESGWQPIETAPRDGKTWIRVGMPSTASPTGWWEAVAVLYPEPEEDHWTDGAFLKHYNGNTLVGGFKGPLTHWQPLTGPPDDWRKSRVEGE
jgi:hypothetical protein